MAEVKDKPKTMDDYPVKTQRVVRHGLFWYYKPEQQVINGEEKTVLVQHIGFHGDAVDVHLDSDIERADRYGALYSEEESSRRLAGASAPVSEDEPEEVELSDLDHEDLVNWLMSTGPFDGVKKPTADEVVEAVGDDPELAARVLDAEQEASGGEPRKQVQERLSKVAEG